MLNSPSTHHQFYQPHKLHIDSVYVAIWIAANLLVVVKLGFSISIGLKAVENIHEVNNQLTVAWLKGKCCQNKCKQ